MVTGTVEWQNTFPFQDARQETYKLTGYMEFTLTAFVPNAYLLEGLTLSSAAECGLLPAILEGTALLPDTYQPGVTGNHVLLHNAGTARAKLNLLLDGIPGKDGVEIINHTTGQRLSIAGDTAPHVYYIDSAYGRVKEEEEERMQLASHVHQGDYLELAPGCPMDRDLDYHQTGNKIRIKNYVAHADDVGRYFYHGTWSRVKAVEAGCLVLDCAEGTGSGTGILTQLNDIEVIRGEDASLEISFDFKPTFY